MSDPYYMPVLPSFRDFAGKLKSGTKGAGKAAGEQVASELEAAVSKTERTVRTAGAAAERAQDRVADATGKVRVAQEQYNKALESGDPVRIARAEETLAKNRRDQARATTTAENATKDLEQAQEQAAKAAREQADAIELGEGALADYEGSIGGVVGKLGGLAAGLAGVAGAAGLAVEGFNVEAQIDLMNRQMGLMGAAATAMGDQVGEVLRSGVAGNAEDAAQAVGALSSQFAYLGSEGEQTASELADNFLAFTDTFGVDMAEATQTAGQLIQNGLAADVESAADLMTAAMQRVPMQMRDELPEIINEYGTNFRALGFSGEEAFGLLVGAAEQGKWALDKTGDALKEFTIRGADMSTASVEAYQLVGLNAEEMSAKVAAGGEGAREALMATADGLLAVENPAERANAAIALFGTPLEDLSVDQIPAFLEGLTGADAAMSGFEGSSQALSDQISNSLQGRMDALKGTVSDLAGDAFMRLWDAATRVSDWAQSNSSWLTPLVVGLGTLVGIVGGIAAATAAWNAALGVYKTVQAIATGQQLLFNSALLANPITWVVIAIAALVAGLVYFFSQTELGQRIWDGFTSAIATGWDWVKNAFAVAWSFIQPILSGLWEALKVVGAILMTAVVVPFQVGWNLISAAISWAWSSIIQPVWNLMQAGLRALGSIFAWVWNSVIKPVWDALGDGIQWVWDNIIRPAWEGMQISLEALGRFFEWVWNSIIKPAWDALGAGIQWVVDNVVRPVFDRIMEGLDLVKASFRTAVDIIGSVWNEIKEKTSAPIRFVIDTVYNKGIVAVWNKVAGWLGMDDKKLEEMKLSFASGGVLPGYTPGRDVHKFINPVTGQGLELSGGEAIMRPEWTRAVGGAAAVDRMNRDARDGRMPKHSRESAAFADGGVLAFARGGIVEAMTRIVQQKYPMLTMTSGYRNSNDNHGAGLAADFSNGSGNTPAQLALARDIADTYPGSMELIYDSPGWDRNIKNGAFVGPFGQFYTWAQAGNHQHHVHWAMNTPPTMPFGGGVFEGGSDGSGGGASLAGSLVRKAMDTIMDPIMSSIPEGPGLIGGLAKGLATKVYDEFQGWILSKVPSSSAGNVDWDVSAGVEQWRELSVDALSRHGYNPSQYIDAMLKQIEYESSGNPNTVNNWDINAINGVPSGGLLQVIEPTYRRVRGRYPEAFEGLPDDRFHPLTNLTAGVGAVRADWGGPGGRWPTRGGYHDGGLSPAGQGWLPKTALEPEFVLNPAMTDAFIDWMRGNPAAGSHWALIKSLGVSTAEMLDPLRLLARDGRDMARHAEELVETSRSQLQHQVDLAAAAAWDALPGEVQDALTVAGAVGQQWERVSGYLNEKAIAWSKGEWPIGSGRVPAGGPGPEWQAFSLDDSLEEVARANLTLAESVISGELSPGADPVANAIYDVFGRDPILPDLARIAAGGPNAIEAATTAALEAFETGETARLEEWTSSTSQLTEAVLRARDAAIETGQMVQGAVNGYLSWAMASDSQGRAGSWQEYFQHYGGEYGTSEADWLLSQVGLGGIIGGKFKDSFANLLIETAQSPLLSAPAILDEDGRVIGTQLTSATEEAQPIAPMTGAESLTADLSGLAQDREADTDEDAQPSSGPTVEVTVDLSDEKSAYTAEEVEQMLRKIDAEVEGIKIEVRGIKAETAAVTAGVALLV